MSATPDKKTAKKSAPRTEMPVQPPFARIRNYLEVALGYGEADAVAEARRCLQCKKPLCRQGCPVEIDIRGFIGQLQKGDLPGAYKVLREYNSLPAVCGRVCPQETQCEGMCILGKNPEKTGGAVAIGRLERYVADTFAQRLGEGDAACLQITGEAACRMTRDYLKVACIGAGPASLTVAGYLAALGVKVTVYEALHEVGGVLVYGIPEFRLPKDIVRREVLAMQELGVEFKTNWVGGKSVTVQELQDQGFQAVFLGVGAGLPQFLKVPGENSIGVFSANEYLTRVNLGRAYDFPNHDTPIFKADNVAVIGAGNVAMDAARTALRLGAKSVSIVYRRTKDEMPARLEELEHAIEEGVVLRCLCGPLEFLADENRRLTGLKVQKMCLGEPDASGRRRPVPVEGDTEVIPVELAVIAVGTRPNPILLEATKGLALNKWGYIEANPETGETSLHNVFAGGDIVTGAATVISAMGAGRKAAKEIARRLLGAEA